MSKFENWVLKKNRKKWLIGGLGGKSKKTPFFGFGWEE